MRQVFYGIFLLAVASLASCSGGIDPAASTVSPAEETREISSSQVDMQAPLTMSSDQYEMTLSLLSQDFSVNTASDNFVISLNINK